MAMARRSNSISITPQSIGRVKAFFGNYGMMLRALAYIQTHGNDGLREAKLLS